jgi:hypothetical protein
MINVSFENHKNTQTYASVNVVNFEDPHDLENQSPLNQTNTTNTGKVNGRKVRPRKNKEAIDSNRPEGDEDKEDDPSESED